MKTSRHGYDAEVAELGRRMLERAAPVAPEQVAAERRAFAMMAMAYFAAPRRAPAPRTAAEDGPLRLGLPGAHELLTPVLLAAACAVTTYLADKAAASSRELIRRMLHRPPGEAGPPDAAPGAAEPPAARLDEEQWREVRRIVTRALMHHGGMPQDRAELMAAAVVGDGPAGQEPSG
ncbi:hypothetical protein ACFV5G_40860 [Streptomyces sp. NPDC059766]|uniref:hypothetical protein n=1 Tax=Streptomyces sp. NPDC059766 TaxID=3346940 RepID=UPI00365346A5